MMYYVPRLSPLFCNNICKKTKIVIIKQADDKNIVADFERNDTMEKEKFFWELFKNTGRIGFYLDMKKEKDG